MIAFKAATASTKPGRVEQDEDALDQVDHDEDPLNRMDPPRLVTVVAHSTRWSGT